MIHYSKSILKNNLCRQYSYNRMSCREDLLYCRYCFGESSLCSIKNRSCYSILSSKDLDFVKVVSQRCRLSRPSSIHHNNQCKLQWYYCSLCKLHWQADISQCYPCNNGQSKLDKLSHLQLRICIQYSWLQFERKLQKWLLKLRKTG